MRENVQFDGDTAWIEVMFGRFTDTTQARALSFRLASGALREVARAAGWESCSCTNITRVAANPARPDNLRDRWLILRYTVTRPQLHVMEHDIEPEMG